MALVLLVEDDPWFADAIEHALESEGYRCVWVRDGAQALEFCQGLRPEVPSLYLGEAMMPVMSGLEFLQLYPGNPFPSLILGSAPLLLREALDLGATGVLQKPFRLELLLEKVAELMSHSKHSSPDLQERVNIDLGSWDWGNRIKPDWLESMSALLEVDCARVRMPHLSGGSGVQNSLSRMALEWGEPLWIQDLESLPLFSAARSAPDLKRSRAFFCIPLASEDGVPQGTLELLSAKPTFISHLDARVLKVLASSLLRNAGSQESDQVWGLSVPEFSQLLELLILRAAATGQALSVIRIENFSNQSDSSWETTLREQGWGGALWSSFGPYGNCVLWWGMEAMTLQVGLASLDLQVSASVFDATQFLGAPQKLMARLFRQSLVASREERSLEAA